jgi:energy-coupling factor transport system ATP-binding protein
MEAAGVTGLRLKYAGTKHLLFSDLSISFRRGEKALLIGPSGCGKSTLLQVLSGLIPHAVEVPMKCEQVNIPESWGYVFQDPDTQFCMPYVDEEMAFVLENLQVPRERMREAMERCLESVGLCFADPHVPIASLSQGMKQRLAIAQLLALEPDVMFLDEPTALLDPQGTREVWDTIRRVSADKTVIIVEHKISQIIDWVDRVILFGGDGQVLADGDKAEVFARHKRDIMEHGIWYPGVWEDYIAGERYRRLRREQSQPRGRRQTASAPCAVAPGSYATAVGSGGFAAVDAGAGRKASGGGEGEALGGRPQAGMRTAAESGKPANAMDLRQFQGYRGGEVKISVPLASVRRGEWIAVVGPNGAGKSTLLYSLMKLLPTAGTHLVHGEPAGSTRSLAQKIAFVFQNPECQFVANSVFEEIAFTLRRKKAPEAEIAAKVDGLLAFFDLAELKDRHPYQLSMGQKRRLSVAAAVAGGQDILLLDEPTFGQDAKNTFAVLERLESWRQQGATILMVTHDMEIVRHFATRVWRVENGRLQEDAHPDTFLRGAEHAAPPAVGEQAAICR